MCSLNLLPECNGSFQVGGFLKAWGILCVKMNTGTKIFHRDLGNVVVN
jgi:hypothetical protein